MYWLLSSLEQDELRDKITNLANILSNPLPRAQSEQVFPFSSRKDRRIARTIIQELICEEGIICDPFSGSGTFPYAALDLNHRVIAGEWEPYAYRLSTAPFRLPDQNALQQAFHHIKQLVEPEMNDLYWTRCANCGRDHVIDSLFYDREPLEYFKPTHHERLGINSENVVFRRGYKCTCGSTQQHFNQSDLDHLNSLERITVNDFPNPQLIENSRINFTYPEFSHYGSLFPRRAKLVLIALNQAINTIEDEKSKDFLLDCLLSIIPQAKYADYRSKSQDPHCPPIKNRENNLWHRFCEIFNKRKTYLYSQFPLISTVQDVASLLQTDTPAVLSLELDFRDCLHILPEQSCSMVITDPPYGDTYQYFEAAQRYHPFMGYSLLNDNDRLAREVVISNSPVRTNKHGRQQFISDIETFFHESARVVRDHGFLVLYFRPENDHWLADLNRLKVFARSNGFEPLITIDVATNDPSMRVLASTAWTFASDIVFIFLKLRDNECRWYEGDHDIDLYIYSAAYEAAGARGEPFTRAAFNESLTSILRRNGLTRLFAPQYRNRIDRILLRFCDRDGARYILHGESPYISMTFGVDAELRVREFAPIVVEELAANAGTFTFEDFILRLATYLDNGDRLVIQRLHELGQLIPQLLLNHASVDETTGLFSAREDIAIQIPDGRTNLLNINPDEFEELIGEFFRRRGFTNVQVVGRSRDRGVDVIATASDGLVHFIQCKRWRRGNNVGSAAIQRVDSMRRTRNAAQAWVVTTSDFTAEGASEARITGVHIINGQALVNSLEIYFPGRFYLQL